MARIIRFYRKAGKPSEVIARGVSLSEAREHCEDPKTSTPDYFDGYEDAKTLDDTQGECECEECRKS